MKVLIVVDNVRDWPVDIPGTDVAVARDYLANPEYSRQRNLRLFNFCRSFRYQSTGYYVSLLAEARGHRPLPDVVTIQDLKSRSIIKLSTTDIDGLVQKSLKPLASNEFTLSIYFGRNLARRYERLARQLFNQFTAPLLRARFARKGGDWQLTSLKPLALGDVPEGHKQFLYEAAQNYFARRRTPSRKPATWRYDMAILVNPEEAQPPSDERALRRFARAARERGFAVEFVTREDYGSLGEFDALFIRETTLVNHHTYRFARRASLDGLVVIDDPESILRCTNKVYLAELLERQRLGAPKSLVVHRDNADRVVAALGLPCVLKQPDGSFSRGVVKVDTEAELKMELGRFLDKSDLVLAQAFVPTAFDWRIGVIDRQPLYACRYYMARQHWQIYKHHQLGGGSKYDEGEADTVAVEQAPAHVVETALKAANAIGDGFYGVDVKDFAGNCQVIEVNDNPSVESGYEDAVLGEALYGRVMDVFLERVQRRKGEA